MSFKHNIKFPPNLIVHSLRRNHDITCHALTINASRRTTNEYRHLMYFAFRNFFLLPHPITNIPTMFLPNKDRSSYSLFPWISVSYIMNLSIIQLLLI